MVRSYRLPSEGAFGVIRGLLRFVPETDPPKLLAPPPRPRTVVGVGNNAYRSKDTTMSKEIEAIAATALTVAENQTTWSDRQVSALRQLGLDGGGRGAPATDGDLEVFFHQVKRTGLDPFLKQIYMIGRQGKYMIQTGIDGFRLIADRSCRERGWLRSEEDTVWFDAEGKEYTAWLSDTVKPTAAKYTALITTPQGVMRFAAVARYKEYDPGSGPMWQKMPATMIAKCAEAAALRKAFPQDLSGLYTDDEMAQADRPASFNPAPEPVPAGMEPRTAAVLRLVASAPSQDAAVEAWTNAGLPGKEAAFVNSHEVDVLVEAFGITDAEIVEDEDDAVTPSVLDSKTRAGMFAALSKAGITGDDEQKAFIEAAIGRTVSSRAAISHPEADLVKAAAKAHIPSDYAGQDPWDLAEGEVA